MRNTWLLIGVLVAAMVAPMLTAGQVGVTITTGTGDVVRCIPVFVGDEITLQFTHSMFGGYVRETWRVTPEHQLERVRFVTENAAAAEYYATEVTSFRVRDGWEVPLEALSQPELVVRVNQRGRHQLDINGTTVPLAELLPESTQVRITVTSSCQPGGKT